MSTIKSLRFDISSGWDGAGVAKAREDISALKRDLDELSGKDTRVNVTVNLQGLDAAKAQLDELAAQNRTATVRVDLQGADAARATLDSTAQNRTSTIRADLQAGDAAARLNALARTRTARVVVDVDRGKLDQLKSTLDDIGKKFDGVTGKAGNLALAIMGIAPAIVPLTAAVLGLGGAIVSSFGSAAIAVAPFAASIIGTYKSSSQLATTVGTLQDHMALLRQEAAAGMNVHKQMATTQLQINAAMKDATPVQRQVAQSILNMKDSWQAFQQQAEKFTGPVLAAGFHAISGAISHMLPLVKAVAPIFQQIADKAAAFANSNGMTKFVDWIIKVGVPNLKNIVATIGHLFVTIGQIIKAFAGNGLGFTQWLSDVTKKLNDWGKAGGFQRFADKVKADWPHIKALLVAGGDAIKAIVKALAGFGPASVSGITLLFKAISKMSPGEIQALAAGFVALRLALVGLRIASAIAAGLQVLAAAAAAAGVSMAAIALPILLVVAVVVALGVVIYLLITHWKEFSTYISGSFMSAVHTVWNALKQFGEWIKTGLTKAWDGIKAAWSAVWNGLVTAWNAVSGALKTAWSATWNFLKSTGQTIWNGIKSAWNTVAHAFATAWNAVSGALKTAWSATWNFLKSTGQTIWNGMKTAWNTVAHAFATAWTAVSGGLKTAWSATWNFMKTAGQAIWNAIKTAWHAFVNDILKTIGEWAIKAVAAVGKFFATLGKDFAKGLKDLAGILLKGGIEAAKGLMEGLIKGLEGGVGGVLGKVAHVAKSVVGGFLSHFHINSPSKDTEDMGHGLNEGLSLGLEKGLVLSLASAVKVATSTINALKNAFKNMSQVGIEAMQLLDAGFKAGMMILQATVVQFGPKITASFKTTFAQLKTTVTQTMTEVNAAVKSGMTQMQASVTAGLNAVKAAWTAAWNNLKSTSTTAWNAIKAAWAVFTKTFLTAWNTASAALKAKWTADWNALKTTATTGWNAIKTAWTTFTKTFQTEWTTAFNALKAQWTTDWTALKTAGQTIWDAMKTAWTKFGTDLNTAWKTASTTLQAAWKTAWTNMNTTAKTEWATITTTIGTAVNKIIGIVNSLIKAWNSVASAVDLPSISAVSPASFAQGGIVTGYAEGGVVGMHMGVNLAGGGVLGGYEPGRDSVPAMLSKGEGVLVPEAVRGLGEGFVHGANHHFSGGRAGRPGGGFSGGRQHFATGGIAGGGVATGAFGLPDPAAVKAMFDPLIAQLRGIQGWSHGAGDKFGGVGQKMEDKLIQAIQAKIAAMMAAMAAAMGKGAQGTAVSGNVKGLAGMIAKALAAAGISPTAANIAAMERRIMIESSGNPNAINNWDINAKMGTPSEGLAQITTTNFAKFGSGNILDPQSNLNAAAKYIKAVYGGNIPQGAAYANGTNNAARGWALVGEEGPEMVNFGGGESVLTADQTNKAMSGGGGGGGTVVNVSIDARGSTPESVDKLKSEAIPQLRMALQAGVGKKGR